METWKYSTTDTYFDLLDFHDAVVEKIEVTEDRIIVDIESINILPQHPLNPFDVAKNTDNCRLVFIQPLSSEAAIFLEGNIRQQIKCTDFKELEILRFERNEQGDFQLYEIFGSDNQFCEWKVKSNGFELCWNEFMGDAWFVNWKNNQ